MITLFQRQDSAGTSALDKQKLEELHRNDVLTGNHTNMGNKIELPRHVFRQPKPHIVPGGDCSMCCLAALLPKGWTIERCYAELLGECKSVSWPIMQSTLWKSQSRELVEEIITDIPRWETNDSIMAYGAPSWLNQTAWSNYIRMALRAGFYALCEVNYAGAGPLAFCNHYVLIYGHSIIYPETSGLIRHVLSISCPAKGEYEIEVEPFLKRHGGYAAILVLPVTERSST